MNLSKIAGWANIAATILASLQAAGVFNALGNVGLAAAAAALAALNALAHFTAPAPAAK